MYLGTFGMVVYIDLTVAAFCGEKEANFWSYSYFLTFLIKLIVIEPFLAYIKLKIINFI